MINNNSSGIVERSQQEIEHEKQIVIINLKRRIKQLESDIELIQADIENVEKGGRSSTLAQENLLLYFNEIQLKNHRAFKDKNK